MPCKAMSLAADQGREMKRSHLIRGDCSNADLSPGLLIVNETRLESV